MPSFLYECLDRSGKPIRGTISTDSSMQAVEQLNSMALTVIALREFTPRQKTKLLTMKEKITIGDIALFSRQLAAMIGAGIPVTNAISILSMQASKNIFKTALEKIAADLTGGMSLTTAFSQHPHIFSNLYISMIRAGEVGGTLEKTLLRLSDQLQKEKILKEEIKSATSYPKAIGLFAVVMFFVMMIFLVPVFKGFVPSGMTVPPISQFIFNTSDSLRSQWYLWIAVFGTLAGGAVLFFKGETGRSLWEKHKLTMPIFGSLILKTVVARFTRTFATLIEGGIPVVHALESAGPTSGSDIVAETVKRASKGIEEGRTIAATLKESGVFPPMVTHMIAVGEETGSLSDLLDKVAEFYEQEVAAETKGLQALIQPIALILIGLMIGGMLIALYLPIFTSIMSSGGG